MYRETAPVSTAIALGVALPWNEAVRPRPAISTRNMTVQNGFRRTAFFAGTLGCTFRMSWGVATMRWAQQHSQTYDRRVDSVPLPLQSELPVPGDMHVVGDQYEITGATIKVPGWLSVGSGATERQPLTRATLAGSSRLPLVGIARASRKHSSAPQRQAEHQCCRGRLNNCNNDREHQPRYDSSRI